MPETFARKSSPWQSCLLQMCVLEEEEEDIIMEIRFGGKAGHVEPPLTRQTPVQHARKETFVSGSPSGDIHSPNYSCSHKFIIHFTFIQHKVNVGLKSPINLFSLSSLCPADCWMSTRNLLPKIGPLSWHDTWYNCRNKGENCMNCHEWRSPFRMGCQEKLYIFMFRENIRPNQLR